MPIALLQPSLVYNLDSAEQGLSKSVSGKNLRSLKNIKMNFGVKFGTSQYPITETKC